MRHGGGYGSALLLILAAVVLLRPWESEPFSGDDAPRATEAEVVRVVDGDTFEARIGDEVEDVRLIGVDTPETVKPGEPVQCYGPQASHFAHREFEGRRLRLVFGAERRDVYDRLLAYVYLPAPAGVSDNPKRPAQRERFLNAELLRRGLARTLVIPPNVRYAERFEALERGAARAGRGLWGHCPA